MIAMDEYPSLSEPIYGFMPFVSSSDVQVCLRLWNHCRAARSAQWRLSVHT